MGDTAVVLVEATPDALEQIREPDTAALGLSYGAVLVDVVVPAGFAVVREDMPAVPPDSDLGRLRLLGDLRNVTSDVQEWIALIVPESSRHLAEKPMESGQNPLLPEVELRQGFTVRATAAGSFAFPPSIIEPADHPSEMVLSESLELEVAIPGRQ